MIGNKVKALVTWDAEKVNGNRKEGITIEGRYLGINHYGSEADNGCWVTDTCLLVVQDGTGIVVEVACGAVTFLE